MKKLMICTFVFTILSCSTTKEVINVSGVDRVKIDQEKYLKPEFYIGEMKTKKFASRSIASVAPMIEDDHLKKLSNRQVYFLSMYKQYEALAKIVDVKNELSSCPSFHDTILEHKAQFSSGPSAYTSKVDFKLARDNKTMLPLYPVLALPVSDSEDLYTKLVENDWKDSDKYLEVSLNKLYQSSLDEVSELCDKGISDGYYSFENIVTYFKSEKDFSGTVYGLKAMLKVPALANMLVLDNLSSVNYHFSKRNVFDTWLLKRSNASWFESYLNGLKDQREEKISLNDLR